MGKHLELTQNDYPIICMAPTNKGFICGHKNAGVITHFEVQKNDQMIYRGQYKIKDDVNYKC